MEEKYVFKCSNPWCHEDNESGYVLIFAEELVDDKNIAAMFCPKCNSILELTHDKLCLHECD